MEWSWRTSADAADLWNICAVHVEAQAQARAVARVGGEPLVLNRLTLDFIREGAAEGDGQNRGSSRCRESEGARSATGAGSRPLDRAALDSGLPPSEVSHHRFLALNANELNE